MFPGPDEHVLKLFFPMKCDEKLCLKYLTRLKSLKAQAILNCFCFKSRYPIDWKIRQSEGKIGSIMLKLLMLCQSLAVSELELYTCKRNSRLRSNGWECICLSKLYYSSKLYSSSLSSLSLGRYHQLTSAFKDHVLRTTDLCKM